MKDHQIRELVNQLRDIAIEYHGTQQLRERIARVLRAAMLQVNSGGDDGPTDDERVRYLAWDGVKVVSRYRHAQPVPVVPDAATAIRACLSEFPESARDIVEECADIAENACRSAMLQAEPVTTANKLGNSPVIGIDPASGPDRTVEVRYVAPPGYVMVPKEPTESMINAWLSEVANWRGHVAGYKAMLAASPQEAK
ncbi:hypothetical protein [Klebsiella aerogenes]|uniref:hypothetical protein n=1 Tax=Klebsiella aerogenes TaxID=548 RepID=UPI000D3634EE|nr:hypothetical protein [Klebsiella aerogenes]